MLLGACTVATLMVIPYALTLIQDSIIKITPALLAVQIIQSVVLFSIAIFFGLRLSARLGFGMPIIEGLAGGVFEKEKFRSILWPSVGLGVLAGLLIIILSIPFGSMSGTFLRAEMAVPVWKSFLASFYGGIGEEILMRFFLMSFLVWITWKIRRDAAGGPTVVGVWLAIIVTSVIFGLGHLPITGGITAITPLVVLRAIVLNGIGGMIFGWLYWRKGLESAMISHFTADICLHVALPVVVGYLA